MVSLFTTQGHKNSNSAHQQSNLKKKTYVQQKLA